MAAAHAAGSCAVVEQMVQDQEAWDAYAYSQWEQESDPAKITAGVARAMRRSGQQGQRQVAFLFPGSEDMPALLEARRLATEAALRAAQRCQQAVERSQQARLEWPQGPVGACPHQSAGLPAPGSSAAQQGLQRKGSPSDQAQMPAAEPGASLGDIAGMLARRRLPPAAPRGASEAQPPPAGVNSLHEGSPSNEAQMPAAEPGASLGDIAGMLARRRLPPAVPRGASEAQPPPAGAKSLHEGSASDQAQTPAAEPGASLGDIAGMLARRRLPPAAPRGASEAQPPPAGPKSLHEGSASDQAQTPAAEPRASLGDIAGMLARQRRPPAAPRGASEAQPPPAGMQSLANLLAHRQGRLRPLPSASDGQVSLLCHSICRVAAA